MDRTRSVLTVLSIGVFAFLAAATGDNSSGSGSAPTPKATPPQEQAAAAPMPMPPQEQAFCEAVQQASHSYEAMQGEGANQMKLSKIKTARGAALREAVPTRTAKDWVGTISGIETNSDGLGVISVKLPCGAEVKTWNNGLSDMDDGTLISQKSALYETLSELKEGVAVQFSGRFFADRANGFKESSLTEAGGMKEPEFIMKFSAAAKR